MSSGDNKHRSHLPIPTPERTGLITYDAKDPDTKFPPIEQLRPPKGAPNLLVILIDDAGFGSASAFGGPCQTPNAEKLAAAGLKYNRRQLFRSEEHTSELSHTIQSRMPSSA